MPGRIGVAGESPTTCSGQDECDNIFRGISSSLGYIRVPACTRPADDRPESHTQAVSGVSMRTQGEIESSISEGMSRFEQEYMGRGPKDIRTHLIGDLLIVRLQGVLTAAEQQLVKTLPVEKGRDLLKQVRTQLIETARPVMEAMVQDITGIKVLSLHHDISTLTGEEMVLFRLAESPTFRGAGKK